MVAAERGGVSCDDRTCKCVCPFKIVVVGHGVQKPLISLCEAALLPARLLLNPLGNSSAPGGSLCKLIKRCSYKYEHNVSEGYM